MKKESTLHPEAAKLLESQKTKEAMHTLAKVLIKNCAGKMEEAGENPSDDEIIECLEECFGAVIESTFDFGPLPFKITIEFDDNKIMERLKDGSITEFLNKN